MNPVPPLTSQVRTPARTAPSCCAFAAGMPVAAASIALAAAILIIRSCICLSLQLPEDTIETRHEQGGSTSVRQDVRLVRPAASVIAAPRKSPPIGAKD
jgi:hypothetical protein